MKPPDVQSALSAAMREEAEWREYRREIWDGDFIDRPSARAILAKDIEAQWGAIVDLLQEWQREN